MRSDRSTVAQSVNKQTHQPLRIKWVGTFEWGTECAHCTQKLIWLDAVANFACSYRRIEETLNDRTESLQKILGQSLERGVARIEGGSETTPLRHELNIAVNPFQQRLSGAKRGGKFSAGVRAGVHLAAQRSHHKVGTLREVAIDRADAHTGLLRNLAHRSIDSRGFENSQCCSQERVYVAPCVSAHGARRKFVRGFVRFAAQFIFPLLNGTLFRIVSNRSDVPLAFYRRRIAFTHHFERSKHAEHTRRTR